LRPEGSISFLILHLSTQNMFANINESSPSEDEAAARHALHGGNTDQRDVLDDHLAQNRPNNPQMNNGFSMLQNASFMEPMTRIRR
jgi:hypothetical protein